MSPHSCEATLFDGGDLLCTGALLHPALVLLPISVCQLSGSTWGILNQRFHWVCSMREKLRVHNPILAYLWAGLQDSTAKTLVTAAANKRSAAGAPGRRRPSSLELHAEILTALTRHSCFQGCITLRSSRAEPLLYREIDECVSAAPAGWFGQIGRAHV